MNEQPTVVFFPEPGAWGPTNKGADLIEQLVRTGAPVPAA